MRDLVRDLEQRVSSGEIPPEGLETFKAAIDDVRLRLWAVLASSNEPGNRTASMQRFRLRRAIDVCRTASADLETGRLDLHHAEVGELRLVADQLALQVETNERRARGPG